MIYEVNKCTEYAMKDENGNPLSSKTTIEGVTTLIESGTVSNAKPIYYHSVSFTRGGDGSIYARAFGQIIILNNSEEPINLSSFINMLKTDGFFGNVINGQYDSTPGTGFANLSFNLVGLQYFSSNQFNVHVRDKTTNAYSISTLDIQGFNVTDLGVNRIN